MSAGHEYLLLGAQLVLGVVASFGTLMTLAFADEVNRGRQRPPLARALQWLSLLLTLAPIIVAVLVLVARWRTDAPLSALVLWSPLLTTLIAAPSFMAALRAMESVTARSRSSDGR
ncbi:hypothetical protein KYC5002_25435 [Archangium violaceum]|uniref:hypothetical protein n=1 Tax=Archangium violaceum TaxID=83451 RepID=UPI002B3151A4|nr:hypothetical protein KYC5002_25435 [Archangium gephyra]